VRGEGRGGETRSITLEVALLVTPNSRAEARRPIVTVPLSFQSRKCEKSSVVSIIPNAKAAVIQCCR
jgi:hypothetical protein